MDQLQNAITQLTGALNAQIELTKTFATRIASLEANSRIPQQQEVSLSVPRSEEDLKSISKLPDSVRDLQVFDGNPVQYISWVHSVESILKDYEIVKTKPIYRAILQHIRYKVRGAADTALISYNIFDENWEKIKNCLSLHYADKRDVQTLEFELSVMRQGYNTVDEYYAKVNHQLSLIINKIKTDTYSSETVEALISSYRNRALDIFIRGLNGDVSRMLAIQKPKTLPEAYTSCLEFQNLNFRNNSIHPRYPNTITTPRNQMYKAGNSNRPQLPPRKLSANEKIRIFNTPVPTPIKANPYQASPPPRPTEPKPPVPMEVDTTMKSHRVNYMNRAEKSPLYNSAYSSNVPRKQQRLFHTNTMEEAEEPTGYDGSSNEQYEDDAEDEELQEHEENELNFMTEAYLAFHT